MTFEEIFEMIIGENQINLVRCNGRMILFEDNNKKLKGLKDNNRRNFSRQKKR